MGFKKKTTINKVFLFLLFLAVISVGNSYSGDTYDMSYRAYVTRIIDGDTLEIRRNNKKELVRLWGIDTPEWNQQFSSQAKAFLHTLIHQKSVEVDCLYFDDYKRVVAMLFYKDLNINEILVETGHAWVHVYYCDKDICNKWRKLESKAKQRRRGLWYYDEPVPPWQWKRNKKLSD